MDKRWMLIGLLALAGCGRFDQQAPLRRPTVTVAAGQSQAGGEPTSAPTAPAAPIPAPAAPPPILSADEISPDGLYRVGYGERIEYPEIQIFSAAGELISADVAEANREAIGYNTKIGCQCATTIEGWVGPHVFMLRITTGAGKSYGYLVDAATGLVDEASFMELRLK
ncbi:MAG TPA: hypothetical protein VGE07_17730 [Herpetosiphonaceae bacterium]